MFKRNKTSDDPPGLALVQRLDRGLTDEQRATLVRWASRLLEIRESSLPALEKAKLTVLETRGATAIFPVIKNIASVTKVSLWDQRSWAARAGIATAAVTAATLGGQGAGIAALGGAIGVPLWVVFGAGATFAGMLVTELTRSLPAPDDQLEGGEESIAEAEWELLESADGEPARLLDPVNDPLNRGTPPPAL